MWEVWVTEGRKKKAKKDEFHAGRRNKRERRKGTE
jgi:hypothetical protein